jgi:hypothetical protein
MGLNMKKIGEYFVGFLLVPWIWVWGYFIVMLVLLLFYRSIDNYEEINLGIMQTLSQTIDLTTMTLLFGGIILLNYTISFFLQKKYPQLNILLFLSSFFLLFLLLLFSWGHFREVLLGS